MANMDWSKRKVNGGTEGVAAPMRTTLPARGTITETTNIDADDCQSFGPPEVSLMRAGVVYDPAVVNRRTFIGLIVIHCTFKLSLATVITYYCSHL